MVFMVRRRALLTLISSGIALPTYTGSYAIHGDTTKGFIELFTSGTLTLSAHVYDAYLVAGGYGGGGGGNRYSSPHGGNGGKSGNVLQILNTFFSGEVPVSIGAGGSGTPGSSSSASSWYTNGPGGITQLGNFTTDILGRVNGGDGAWNSNSATGSTVQVAGTDGIFPFNDNNLGLVSGSGGGGATNPQDEGSIVIPSSGAAGGLGGGGKGGDVVNFTATVGSNGTANTGGGAGGGAGSWFGGNFFRAGGAGGSGLVIVRWGY